MDTRDRILALLGENDPMTIDDLMAATGEPQWIVNSTLTALLLAGLTRPVKLRRGGRIRTHHTLKAKVQQ